MYTRRCFMVTDPPIISWLWVYILCFLIILVVLNTIFLSPPYTAMYICITVLVFIPVTSVIPWTKIYRIRVNGLRITVKKGLDLVKFSFVITDVRNVQWEARENTFTQDEIIAAFIAQGKRFKVEGLTVNADRMQASLTDYAEENRIKRM